MSERSTEKPQTDGYYSKNLNWNNNGFLNAGFIPHDKESQNGLVLQISHSDTHAFSNNFDVHHKDNVPVIEQRKAPLHSVRSTLLGCLLSLLGALLVAFGQGCLQLLDGRVGDFQLVSMRTAFQATIGASYFLLNRKLPKVKREKWIWLFCSCSCAVSVNTLFGIGVTYIPAGIAACFRRCTDVILITVFCAIIFKEGRTPLNFGCVVTCLVGVVMLIQPWYSEPEASVEVESFTLSPGNTTIVNSTEAEPQDPEDNSGGVSDEITGYILVVAAGVCAASQTLLLKYKLGNLSPFLLNLYTGSLGFTVTGTISLATEDLTFPSDAENIIYVVIQTCVWGMAALCRYKGTGMAPALLVTMAFSMQIVFLLIGQYTVLSEVQPGVGNWVEITGAVLILLAILAQPGWILIKAKLLAVDNNPQAAKREEEEFTEAFPDSFDMRM